MAMTCRSSARAGSQRLAFSVNLVVHLEAVYSSISTYGWLHRFLCLAGCATTVQTGSQGDSQKQHAGDEGVFFHGCLLSFFPSRLVMPKIDLDLSPWNYLAFLGGGIALCVAALVGAASNRRP